MASCFVWRLIQVKNTALCFKLKAVGAFLLPLLLHRLQPCVNQDTHSQCYVTPVCLERSLEKPAEGTEAERRAGFLNVVDELPVCSLLFSLLQRSSRSRRPPVSSKTHEWIYIHIFSYFPKVSPPTFSISSDQLFTQHTAERQSPSAGRG